MTAGSHRAANRYVLEHTPLHQLERSGEGEWTATGDDPQFLLSCPLPLPGAGIYRFTAHIEGPHVSRPCLYLDFGEGWAEETRVDLVASAEGRWEALVELSVLAETHRLDPTDCAGRFAFRGVVLQRLEEAEALLVALGEGIRRSPQSARAMVESLVETSASSGVVAACGRLLRGEIPKRSQEDAYAGWIARHDTLSQAQRARLPGVVDRLRARPLISLFLPVEGVSLSRLRTCVQAVQAQAYPDWELLLACEPAARSTVLEFAQTSSRIRVIDLPAGAGEVGALRHLASAARGDLVAWLGGAPVMPEHALLVFARAACANPAAKIFYSDGDRLDLGGRRTDPWFRPDWNPDLFLSTDFLAGVAMLDSTLLRTALRAVQTDAGLEAAMLRCAMDAGTTPQHIPLVLWHLPTEARPASSAMVRAQAVEAYLSERGTPIRCEATDAGVRVRWPLPEQLPKVSILVPTRDRVALLSKCVHSVLSLTTYPHFELVVIDNQSVEASTREYLAEIAKDPRVRILQHDAPFNYSAINNRAVEQVDGDLVVLLNNDIEVITPDWLEEMVSQVMRDRIGAVGAMLYYPDNTIQHAGIVLGLGGVAGHVYSREPRGTAGSHGRAALVQQMSAATAACLLVRRSAFLEVGGLDETLRVAFNDVDLCLRLGAAGYSILWTPFAEFYHHESASRGLEDTPEKRARFAAEVARMHEVWGDRIADDPAYSPNLSLRHGSANVLAEPPRASLAQWLERAAGEPALGTYPACT